jgi:hypothetical protein
MMELNVKSNAKAFIRQLSDVERKQVPFALARALTWTVQECQKAEQDRIPKTFNVTKKWWMKRQPTGIKIHPAKKGGPLAAEVFTKAYFAWLQEEGGQKIPYKGKGLLIPSTNVPKYGRKAGGAKRVLAGKRVLRRGGKSSGSVIFTMQSGKRGAFRRKGKRKYPIELLYTYKSIATIAARFGFRDLAYKVAVNVFEKKFSQSLAQALRTAR